MEAQAAVMSRFQGYKRLPGKSAIKQKAEKFSCILFRDMGTIQVLNCLRDNKTSSESKLMSFN